MHGRILAAVFVDFLRFRRVTKLDGLLAFSKQEVYASQYYRG